MSGSGPQKTFWNTYAFHPGEAKTSTGKFASGIATVAMAIFTLGIGHLIAYYLARKPFEAKMAANMTQSQQDTAKKVRLSATGLDQNAETKDESRVPPLTFPIESAQPIAEENLNLATVQAPLPDVNAAPQTPQQKIEAIVTGVLKTYANDNGIQFDPVKGITECTIRNFFNDNAKLGKPALKGLLVKIFTDLRADGIYTLDKGAHDELRTLAISYDAVNEFFAEPRFNPAWL
jgi:hypothetical protein